MVATLYKTLIVKAHSYIFLFIPKFRNVMSPIIGLNFTKSGSAFRIISITFKTFKIFEILLGSNHNDIHTYIKVKNKFAVSF